jgi:hypothetical protein
VGGGASLTALVSTATTASLSLPADLPTRVSLRAGQMLALSHSLTVAGECSVVLSLVQGSTALPPTMTTATASYSDGFLTVSTADADVHHPLTIMLTARNATVVTALLRENALSIAVLAAGQPQRDRVGATTSRLFSFAVPAEASGVLTFSLDSFYVSDGF